MKSVESTTDAEELSGRALGVICSYGMGAALDPRDLYLKTAREPSQSVAPAHGEIGAEANEPAGRQRRAVRA